MRGYVYTLGAFIFACILTGIFVWIRFQYGLLPLQRYYLPYYLRTETAGLTHRVSQYQLLYVSDGAKAGKAALESDVQPGSTPQFGGKPLPLMLTPEAAKLRPGAKHSFHPKLAKVIAVAAWGRAEVIRAEVAGTIRAQ